MTTTNPHRTRPPSWRTSAALLILSCSAISCAQERPETDWVPEVLRIEDIGVIVEMGSDEQADILALLHRPVDASFIGDDIYVLDASPPWVRVFNREGEFLRALVEDGDGPGEARSPWSIARTGNGGFLLSHGRGFLEIDSSGSQASAMRRSGYVDRGIVEACGGERFVLGFPPSTMEPPGFLARIGHDEVPADTLMVFGTIRWNNYRSHPWFVDAQDDRLVMFTEEEGRARLIEFDCSGAVLEEIPLDSLGRGERWEEPLTGGFFLHPAEAPLPAGIARVGDHLLWAVNAEVETGQERRDSVTVMTAFHAGAETARIQVEGWFQLLDSDDSGAVLMSNSWGRNRSWRDVPAVYLVPGEALLDALARQPRVRLTASDREPE